MGLCPITNKTKQRKIEGGEFNRAKTWQHIYRILFFHQFSSAQLLSHVWPFGTPWTAAHQAFLSITNSRRLLKHIPSSWWCHPNVSSLLSSSPPVFKLSQDQGLFQWISSSHQVAKVLELQFQHQSFQWKEELFSPSGL